MSKKKITKMKIAKELGLKTGFSISFSKKLIDLLGEPREPNSEIIQKHLDLAKSTQLIYEEVLFHLTNLIYEN